MPVLHLSDVPMEMHERLQQLAATHHNTPEMEAVHLLHKLLLADAPCGSQAELLAELRRRSFTPPAGSPDSVALLAEDRGR